MVIGSSSSASSKLKLLALVLAVFAISECCSVSAVVWGIWLDPAIVYIQNELWNGTELALHCKSKDDDLGLHFLKYKEAYQWEFKINYWGRTLFWCNFGFYDKSRKLVQGGYQVYRANRDVKKCGQGCQYSVRLDGLYVWPKNKDWELVYTWPK